MLRTRSDLERAAGLAGVELVDCRSLTLADGSSTIAGRFVFSDPWAAARLLVVLSDEDADDPRVAEWAAAILAAVRDVLGPDATPEAIRDAFAAALHRNVQKQIRFEPEEGEQFQSALATMIEGVGDCDCHARLVHALARSQGLGSSLRFFEQDGEPTHVVAALDTSAGPAWAETTIGAHFAEHPHEALHRLGLDRGARADIGDVGGVKSVADLADLIRVVDYQVSELEAFTPCAWSGAASWRARRDQLAASYQKIRDIFTAWIATVPDALQTSTPADWPADPVRAPISADRWGTMVRMVGAFTALDRELRAACRTGPSYPNMPQPTRSDLDLTVYNFAGGVLDRVATGLSIASSPWTWAAAGAVGAAVLVAVLRR